MLRIITALVVFIMGALLLCVDTLVDRSTRLDDYGIFMVVVGLVSLGLELYVVPFFARRAAKREE